MEISKEKVLENVNRPEILEEMYRANKFVFPFVFRFS